MTEHFTGEEWTALLECHGGRCVACGISEGILPDHIVAMSRGGSNRIENIQPLCVSCNARKSVKSIDFTKGEIWNAPAKPQP